MTGSPETTELESRLKTRGEVAAGGARGTMTGSPETTELESRLKTRGEVAERATGEPLRTMCPRRARRLTQPLTRRAKKKSPPLKKLNQNHQGSSLLKNLRPRLLGKRRRSICPWMNGRSSKPRRRVPSSTCG